ncbi:amino acid ABC transporter substrate-binding protein [Ralstonia pseudosolanacearum]|uniref:Amino acid ABC transporter substrate-binding protein n=1 Tax=Ralstonia solanacearum TaxID=305 RepID=A0AA92Q981_RALSL|nr:amino acid ABC transporter substrate-binding protein [Ralstonia pseudosolanacearum]QOK94650.1 amino acid ABC transporter substrate-binding protein [Ralstonia pseudosolanacearum]QOK99546.1 amino acid ABC transporter substrate-binding protein [Ralstonia pseudosolanacearum]UWD88855.1 amino acid ABC transporter substrate-binding protein [Ralstonia pseudosolanacearum]CAH0442289.1 Glutamate/aspartate import solute-binding protein [Ralstonia pseudosolanacearum]
MLPRVRKLLPALLALPLLNVNALASSPTLDHIKATGAIRLAHRDSSVPFSYLDANGKPIGYSMDLCMRLVDAIRDNLKRPDLRVQYLSVTPATRMDAIANGKADLECASTNNARERREKVAFTIPHYIANGRMLVKTASGIHQLEDLRGKTVVSTRGSENGNLVRQLSEAGGLGITVVETADHGESFAMLADGKAQALAMDDVLLAGMKANVKNPADYAIVGKTQQVVPYAIMLSKNDPEFKKLIDAAMSKLMEDGEAERLYKKWFQQPIPPNNVNLGIPMSMLLRDSFRYPTDNAGN